MGTEHVMEGARERPSRPPPPGGATSSGHRAAVDNYTKVKELHDEAFLYIDQGLTCDEHGQLEQALTLYTKGLRCIDQASHLAAGGSPTRQEKLNKLATKMSKTRTNISARVDELICDSTAGRMVDDPPPSYEMATTPTAPPVDGFDIALAESILADDVSDTERPLAGVDASVLFSIREGVQIFFITPEGYVSAPSYPSSLTLYKFTDSPQAGERQRPPAFLKVGDWTYPLQPGRSPVLHANWGAYVFPDVNAVDEGSSVGLIIPDSVGAADREKLEQVLASMTNLRVQTPSPTSATAPPEEDWVLPEVEMEEAPPRPPPPVGRHQKERTSQKISSGIVTTAEWLSWGLVKGAEQTGRLVKYGSSKLQQKLQPELEKAEIDPRVRQGVFYAKEASHVAVRVSTFLVDGLGKATMAIGRQVAPHIKKQGEKYLPASFTEKQDGASKVDEVITVAAGGIQGWATVYQGLESAAKILAKNIKHETVNVVGHKYGGAAGTFAGDTMQSAFNIGYSAHNFSNLGVKAVAKRAAKDTGKAFVETDDNQHGRQGQTDARRGGQTNGGHTNGGVPEHLLPENKTPM